MSKFINPFETDIHKTERTLNQKLVEWINQIIQKEKLPFGYCEQETGGSDLKQPDIILFKLPQSKEVILVLELKKPYFNPLDFGVMKEPAWKKAVNRKAPYFATSNFQSLILFNTQKVNEQLPELQQIVNKYNLSAITDINLIDEPIYKNQIYKSLAIFLKDLAGFIFEKKEERKLAVDEWLVLLLQEHVSVLSSYYHGIIREQCLNNLDFRRRLQKWFNDQGWNFVFTAESTYAKAARQTAYWLTNKILFYDVLRTIDPQHFPQVKIPDDYNSGGMVRRFIQIYFDEVLKLDYETIFSSDFIDEVAFPEDKNVVSQIRKLTDDLNRFNFSEIEFEVLGQIFEKLIPTEERHNLGQYYTNADIVDLILQFAIQDEKDALFDPGCGAGTFLRRAYHLKKMKNSFLTHEEILATLWGNDIDKFAAGLTTINLAIADLRSKENYPRVVQKDFFEWFPGRVELPEQKRKIFFQGLGKNGKEITLPKYFDAIVGNPPYTRQEEMDDLNSKNGQEYKENLINRAVLDEAGRPYANLTKRACLYAYFFVHGTKFLKEGGRFGFIVSNSWLDVDYGKGLQEHFLKNYKIKAIIESKVERWFEQADINTCVVLLEKCSGENNEPKKEREENLVRFVNLKKPLSDFIPKASRIFEETVERKAAVEKLLDNIFSQTQISENENLRVFVKTQKELWEEGFNNDKQEYVGTKWGKYLRAPPIYFKILKKAKDKLVPLKKIADVRFGIKTGANEFFYLTEEEIKRRRIEKEFWMHQDEKGVWIPNYIIKSPKECGKIVVEPKDLKYRVLMIHKTRGQLRGKKVLDYIREGESQGFSEKDTCAQRSPWYDLGNWAPPDLIWPDAYNDRYGVFNTINNFADKRFFFLYFNDKSIATFMSSFLNSTIISMQIEINGITNLGEGAIYTNVYWLQEMLVPRFDEVIAQKLIKIIDTLKGREIDSVFEEIGARRPEDVMLEKVKPDRRELDKIIMGEILGLTEEEQLEVYRAVVDLVKSRLEKAKSVQNGNKTGEGINLSLLVKTVLEKVDGNRLGRFYGREIAGKLPKEARIIKLPQLGENSRLNQTLMGFRIESGKESLDFSTEEEAKYTAVFMEAGWEEVKMPSLEVVKKVLPKLEKIVKEIKEAIADYSDGVLDSKVKNQVEHLVWREVSKEDLSSSIDERK